MDYKIKANSISDGNAFVVIKASDIVFGINAENEDKIPNPAELFLGSLSACILKSVERFSGFMNFEYSKAETTISATRLEKPPKLDQIHYELTIYTSDKDLNLVLLKKNIEKFGTIYNTVKGSCEITGEILVRPIH